MIRHWFAESLEVLLGHWQRIGVGFDWSCPKEEGRGVFLVGLVRKTLDSREKPEGGLRCMQDTVS